MNTIYGITQKEVKKLPIFAGMEYTPGGKIISHKIRKVGYKWVEFTYDVNPNNSEDKMLTGEKEIKRIINP